VEWISELELAPKPKEEGRQRGGLLLWIDRLAASTVQLPLKEQLDLVEELHAIVPGLSHLFRADLDLY
jgi:hypothetical protein